MRPVGFVKLSPIVMQSDKCADTGSVEDVSLFFRPSALNANNESASMRLAGSL